MKSPKEERAGRDRPQQAAVIAVRKGGDGVEVCLIRRMELRKWGIPKGMIDPGDTLEQTALKEAWEEAGIKGRLMEAIGTYDHDKWGGTYVVTVYLMEVLEQDEDWPEADFRERRWAPFEEAALMLADHPGQPLLARARQLIAGTLGWPIDITGR